MSAVKQTGSGPVTKPRVRPTQPLNVAQVADALLRISTVEALTGLGKSTIYAKLNLIRNLPQPAGAGPTSAEISGPARQISADFTETASALALQWLISRNR